MARKKQNKLFVVKDVVKANSIKEYKEKCNTYNLSKREKAKELSLTWGKTIDPLAWMERTSSELAMTWDSVGGLEGINSALKDNYGNIYMESLNM